jgi:hypothetical protein
MFSESSPPAILLGANKHRSAMLSSGNGVLASACRSDDGVVEVGQQKPLPRCCDAATPPNAALISNGLTTQGGQVGWRYFTASYAYDDAASFGCWQHQDIKTRQYQVTLARLIYLRPVSWSDQSHSGRSRYTAGGRVNIEGGLKWKVM